MLYYSIRFPLFSVFHLFTIAYFFSTNSNKVYLYLERFVFIDMDTYSLASMIVYYKSLWHSLAINILTSFDISNDETESMYRTLLHDSNRSMNVVHGIIFCTQLNNYWVATCDSVSRAIYRKHYQLVSCIEACMHFRIYHMRNLWLRTKNVVLQLVNLKV